MLRTHSLRGDPPVTGKETGQDYLPTRNIPGGKQQGAVSPKPRIQRVLTLGDKVPG